MKIEVLIDGYNFLRARTGVRLTSGPGNLEKAREALIRWLAERFHDHQSLTVVFDASQRMPFAGPAERIQHGIRIKFAHHYPDADSLIAELVSRHHFPKQLIVVSNDREVQRSARRRDARPMRCEEFESYLLTHSRPTADSDEKKAKNRSPSASEREFWLDVFGKDLAQSQEIDESLIRVKAPEAGPASKSLGEPAPPTKLKKSARKSRPTHSTDSSSRPIPLSSLADFYEEMLASEKSPPPPRPKRSR